MKGTIKIKIKLKSGFTLVEIMIVVAIIGLLAAIAPHSAQSALDLLKKHGVSAQKIGRVIEKRASLLSVT